jgi:carboxymethylenebutenolidase
MCFDAEARPPVEPHPDGFAESGEVILTASDGTRMRAFRARGRASNGVGVLVLPDQRGLHRYYEELAERFAELGMDALAIDWYARTAGTDPHAPDFDEYPHIPGLTFAGLLADITAGLGYLRSPAGGGAARLVPVGFCLGGRLAFLCPALDLGVAGAVGFYGRPTDVVAHGSPPPISVVDRLEAPILGIFAGRDEHIPTFKVEQYRDALATADADARILIYPDAPHSFFDIRAAEFADESAAAWAETLRFLTSGIDRSS